MLAKLTRLFPLWAVLLSVAAYYSPSTFIGIGPWVTHAADADHVRHGRARSTSTISNACWRARPRWLPASSCTIW